MSDEDAFALLASARPSERLRGARLLAAQDDTSKILQVLALRQRETDSWVRSALDRVLRRWQEAGATVTQGDPWISLPQDADLEDIRAEAIASVTQTLVHEIRGLLRAVSEAASADLGERFAESSTNSRIARLREFLETVRQLHDAASAPRYREFDLSDFTLQAVHACGFTEEQVIGTRTDPVVAHGDPDLLELALVNALRNAVEASVETGTRVIVTCAVTDTEGWITVLDDGIGLPDGFEHAIKAGETTKSKSEHFGWGLAIAQRAVHSLGGQLRLTPRELGGAACEIRWPLQQRGEG